VPSRPTQAELIAYLDESLSAEDMAAIETALRLQPELLEELAQLASRRDAGVHSLGEIWRRRRLSCPSREEIGRSLLGVLDDEHTAYIQFHLTTIGCRTCQSNFADLKRSVLESPDASQHRRNKIFHSSAGQLRKQRRDSTK
jgi:hypothetical protein